MRIGTGAVVAAVLAFSVQARADDPARYRVTQAPIVTLDQQQTETVMWDTATGRSWILRTIPSAQPSSESSWTTVWVPIGFIPGMRRPDASLLPPNK